MDKEKYNLKPYSYKIIIDNKEVTITRTFIQKEPTLLTTLFEYVKNKEKNKKHAKKEV